MQQVPARQTPSHRAPSRRSSRSRKLELLRNKPNASQFRLGLRSSMLASSPGSSSAHWPCAFPKGSGEDRVSISAEAGPPRWPRHCGRSARHRRLYPNSASRDARDAGGEVSPNFSGIDWTAHIHVRNRATTLAETFAVRGTADFLSHASARDARRGGRSAALYLEAHARSSHGRVRLERRGWSLARAAEAPTGAPNYQ
eukprot:scaffold94974_cov60-Phaeocystis_antarctica.AAC.15